MGKTPSFNGMVGIGWWWVRTDGDKYPSLCSSIQATRYHWKKWSEDWQIQFNVDKCKVTHVGKHNPELTYLMENAKLEIVHEGKELGVLISDDLKCSTHCIRSYMKANHMLGLINRTVSTKQPSILLQQYKSLVRPHLEYCSLAWSSKYVKDKELLERVQHWFTHLFKYLWKLDYIEWLQWLGLWTLEEERCNTANLIEVCKMVNSLSTLPTSTLFEFRADTRTFTEAGDQIRIWGFTSSLRE